ncbi:hypothetical protein GCM10022262_00640 [Georgenia daeguensis]|uniref:Uncharacterized protein n=1 Tax=Georgenia daeguensis TaxID=908355 RepID=A0ABP8EP59_9MICO
MPFRSREVSPAGGALVVIGTGSGRRRLTASGTAPVAAHDGSPHAFSKQGAHVGCDRPPEENVDEQQEHRGCRPPGQAGLPR